MKRLIAILVLVFYFFPAIGFSIDIHWCGKKISNVSLNSANHRGCSNCKEKPMKCCKNRHISVKIKGNQHNSSALKVQPGVNPIAVIFINGSIPGSVLSAVASSIQYRPPPLPGKQPVYLSNKVFRV